jgi:hypothetical protein
MEAIVAISEYAFALIALLGTFLVFLLSCSICQVQAPGHQGERSGRTTRYPPDHAYVGINPDRAVLLVSPHPSLAPLRDASEETYLANHLDYC